jgi:hypothetical protein
VEQVHLVCGRRRPQLKRDPLDGAMADPIHPLFAPLSGAELLELHFVRSTSSSEAVLDIVLRDGSVLRRFRFTEPQNVHLQPPFPDVGYLQVFDVTARRLDRLRVRVADGEMSEAISFWAAGVEEISVDGAV